MKKNKNIQRYFASFILFFFVVQISEVPLTKAADFFQDGGFSQNPLPTAQAAETPKPENHWGIIAILVEDALMQEPKSYSGLTTSYADKLKAVSLADRIRRYSIDAQSSQEFTKSLIIRIPPTAKVENIANSLEKLYFQGDGTKNEINKLTGIVIVGNVPLPVINKKGHRFISMLPYTDFDDKAYFFDPESGDYLSNPNTQFSKGEIWHGVIKPPVPGEEAKQLLANYFDKNHLFHVGDPDFAIFDKKLLLADLFNEFKSMDKFQFNNYLRYINHLSDLAYLRFNKNLAEKFYQETNQKIGEAGIEIKPPPAGSCDKECIKAKNSRNVDFDGDGYTNGYELEVGSKTSNGNVPTDPRNPESLPIDYTQGGNSNRTSPNPQTYQSSDDGSKQDYPDPSIQSGTEGGFKSLPDIQSRQIILNFVSKYVQLFNKFLASNNDWANFSGRYEAAYKDAKGINRSDVHTIPSLISIKDNFSSQYLRLVNDAVERKIDEYANLLQAPVVMLQNSKLKGSLVLSSDDSSHGLADTEFVNFASHKYLTLKFPFFGEGLTINGNPFTKFKSVADCMLYRGSNDGSGKNSVMVKAIRTLNPNTGGKPDENKDYAGCYGNNLAHPERCAPTKATKPIFDINGATEVDPANVPQSATDYRSCFDFKEVNRYNEYENEVGDYIDALDSAENEEQKKAIPAPGAPHKSADQIILYDDSNVKVTLTDVLQKFGRGDGKDNDGDGTIDNAAEGDPKYGIPKNDWQQVGERLLKKNQEYVFDGNPFPGVKKLTLTATPQVANDTDTGKDVVLPSILYHKEPTQDIYNNPYTSIASQLQGGGVTPSLPIDNPRYVAFQDKTETYRKLIYPDAFSAPSLDEYLKTLAQKEIEIQTLAAQSGIPISPNFLANIFSGNSDIYDASQKNILKANKVKLEDTLQWKNFNIDQKHQYVLENYLSQKSDPFIEKIKNGYEAMYLVGDGRADQLEMRFNGNYPEEEKDPEFNEALNPTAPPPSSSSSADDPNNQSADQSQTNESGVIIFEWFGAMVKWLDETSSKLSTTSASQPYCGTDYDTSGLDAAAFSEAISTSASGLTQSDSTSSELNQTVKLRVSIDKNVLQTGGADTLKLRIEGLSSANVIQKGDNKTLVDIKITNPKDKNILTVLSPHPLVLINGVAILRLQSTSQGGDVTISAFSKEKNIVSNNLKITSTNRKIRIVTYRKEGTNIYAKTAAGFIIKDAQDHIIAEVNGKTGFITIKDDLYQLIALPSSQDKPVRLAVQEKNTGLIIASIFFIADIKKAVSIDDGSMDYEKSYSGLQGTHLKDLVLDDDFIAEASAQDKSNPGGVYLYEKTVQIKKKIGLIDPAGNIFLAAGYDLQLKAANNSADPVIFQIVNKTNQALFEIFIGTQSSKLQIIQPEGNYQNYNVADERNDEVFMAPSFSPSKDTLTIVDALKINNVPATSGKKVVAPVDNTRTKTENILIQAGLLKKDLPLFKDLKSDHEGYADIMKLAGRMVVEGYKDGNFKPEQLLTREEFIKLDLGAICTACTNFKENIKRNIEKVYRLNPFPDQNITPNLLYCVEEGKNRRIISGYQGGDQKGYFIPQTSISRAEATKVILETARQQNNKINLINEALEGKPWYYNYILTAQKERLYPKNRFKELDSLSPADFKKWFDGQLANPQSLFIQWLSAGVTRAEFAIMVARLMEKSDCYQDDKDQDGLPDNLEKFSFGTDPGKADTDGGGIQDGDEILNGTDPLAPADDQSISIVPPKIIEKNDKNKDSDGDGMPDVYELKFGLNPFDPTDGGLDKDGDGLTNFEEFHYGTDPTNPDTDGGGVDDGDEVLHDSDPLNKNDDELALKNNEGTFIVGKNISENYIYETSNPNPTDDGKIEYISQIPADGQNQLFVRAEILDEKGDIDTTNNNSIIEFFALDNTDPYAKLTPNNVKTVEGVAETTLQSTTTAGEYQIGARLKLNDNLPTDEKPVFVTPLEPNKIELKPESVVIKSGGLSTTVVHTTLKDLNNNLVNSGSYQLTFELEGKGELDNTKDEDPTQPGIQMSSVSGMYDLIITSQKDPGTITLKASWKSPEDFLYENNDPQPSQQLQTQPTLTAQTTIMTREDLHIGLTAASSLLPTDGKTVTKIEAKVLDKNNQVLAQFNGNAKFTLLQDSFGKLVTSPDQKVTNGKSAVVFQASKLAGNATLAVTINGFDPANLTLSTLPKKAQKVILETEHDTLDADPSAAVQITAKLYDEDNNFVANDSSTKIKFRLTDATKNFGQLENSNEVQTKNGLALMNIRGTSLSGPVHVVASVPGLPSAALEMKSVTKLKADTIKKMAPNVLFASLLGADYGNIMEDNYLGGWFVFSGKSESAIAITSNPKPSLRLAQIDRNGKLNLLNSDSVQAHFIPSNDLLRPNRLIVTDPLSKEALAEVFMIEKPQIKATIIPDVAIDSKMPEAVYIQNLTTTTDYLLQQNQEGVSIVKNGNEAVSILHNGNIKLFDNNLTITFDENQKSPFLSLKINDQGVDVARITFANNFAQGVKKLPLDFVFDAQTKYESGVYLHPLTTSKKIKFESAFSGNSSLEPKSFYIVDENQDIEKSQAPGQNYLSLEASPDTMGIGFTGNNKHMLLFAAGNSVGESNVPYSSEIGIVLGDPTIRLNNKINVSKTGYTKDIGQEIYFGDVPIEETMPIDYNSDGLKDLLIAYEDGKIRLLQNNRAYPRFTDRGIFLDFPNGLLSMDAADFNKDGQEDLIVATQDSCRKGEVCIDEYENHNGNFVRKNLPLKPFDENNRAYMVRAADMNNDSYPDVIVSDDAGDVRVFYNNKGLISSYGQLVGSLGLHIDNKANLKKEILVAYDGMPQNDPNVISDDQSFKELPVTEIKSALSAGDQASLEALKNIQSKALSVTIPQPQSQTEKPFIYLDVDPLLVTSEKRAKDLTQPLSVLMLGDEVQYTLILNNSSNYDLKNFLLSDAFPANLDIDKASITCLDCGQEKIKLLETGMSLRPFIISGFTLPKNKSRTITYQAKVKETPKIKIALGQNLSQDYAPQDNFMDIGASPEGNSTGRMTYFYSLSQDPKTRQINYGTYVSAPPDPKKSEPSTLGPLGEGPLDNDSFQETDEDGIPLAVKKLLKNQTSTDKNSDGLPDSWDDANGSINSGLEEAANTIQAITSAFTCGGGCIPMPINFAFLAPGAINVMGVPGGFDPGLPIFAWGVPSVPPVPPIWPPAPYQGSLGGRIYLSPTLTMSLGTGICLGPYLAGTCFTFAIPPSILGMAEACQSIAGGIDKAMSSANSFIQGAGNSALSTNGAPSPSADASGRSETGGMTGSTTLGSYQYKGSVSTNISVPGFPGVITQWLSDQTSEIINKLTDLPDFYFIYPDPTSMIGSVVPQDTGHQSGNSPEKKAFEFPSFAKSPLKDDQGNVHLSLGTPSKILSFINSMPLVQIKTQEIPFKVPALSPGEIEKLQSDMRQWVQDEKAELERVKALWKCGQETQYQSICDKVTVNLGSLIKNMEKNIETLEKYKQLPHLILAWKNITAKYLYQIICYMDAIIQFTGGYVKKQQSRIELWMVAIRKVKELILSWKAIIDLVVEYQTSCDRCSTARFSLMELILKLFAVIPSPPIIPFPKWPDIYLDLSQIQTGLKITWPDVKFIPEKVIVPKLPRITLPDVPNVNVDITFPPIPILPDLPPLPELPDLPPLPIPSLPDVPPPPEIPGMPASLTAAIGGIKAVLKIVCLLKAGLLPVSELYLKSNIEQLTERSLDPVLPFDLGVSLQIPPIEYESVDHIEVKGILNLQLDVSAIYDFTANLADNWNSIATDLVHQVNQKLNDAGKATNSAAGSLQKAGDQAIPSGDVNVNLGSSLPRMRAATTTAIDSLTPQDIDQLSDAETLALLAQVKDQDPIFGPSLARLEAAYKDLEKEAKIYAENNKKIEQDIYLTATQKFLSKDDPVLNRSLDEIKTAMASQDLSVSPQRFVSMRDAFIAYADHQNILTEQIGNTKDLQQMGVLLASTSGLKDYLPENKEGRNGKMTASLNDVIPAPAVEETENADAQSSTTIQSVQSLGQEIQEHTQSQLHLFLADANLPPVPSPSGVASTPQVVPKGIYIYNPAQEVNERLINNTDEADQTSHLNFLDIDNDGDEDVIYSYGGNIYLKENYKSAPVHTYYGGDPEIKTLNDYIPAAPAINNFGATLNNNKSVQLNWAKATGPIVGYEISYDLMPDAYESKSRPLAHKIGALLGPVTLPENPLIPPVQVNLVKGVLQQNGSIVKDNKIMLEQPLQTGDNTELNLNYLNGSQIKLGSNINFRPPHIDKAFMVAQNVQGDVTFNGLERTLVFASNTVAVKPEEIIHTLMPTTLMMSIKGIQTAEITLPANAQLTISKKILDAISIQVIKGGIEVINPDKIVPNQKLTNGLLLDFDTQLTAKKDGSATVNLTNGAYLRLDNNQDLILKKLDTVEEPGLLLDIPNGFYYTQIRSIDQKGFLSTPSSLSAMSPSVCADKNPPYVNAGASERTVSIFKTLTIDATKSFDTEGEVTSYYLDTDLNVDTDGDGDPTNDRNVGRDQNITFDSDEDHIPNNELNDPIFTLGPYQDLADREVMLNVLDQSLNRTQQSITIHVTVPAIQLDPETATSGKIQGHVDPGEDDIPVSIIRDRGGVKKSLLTKSASAKGKYFTGKEGAFIAGDLNLQDATVIKDEKGQIIAEVDSKTGRVILKDNQYHLEVLPAEIPLLPTRIVIKKNSDNSLIATLFLVSDANTDTVIDPPAFPYNSNTVALFKGVHSKDDSTFDEFELRKVPADDLNDPGATEIFNTKDQKRSALLDTGGNFYIDDNRLSLRLQKAENLSEPLIIEVLFTSINTPEPVVIAEFNISIHDSEGLQVLPKEKFKALVEGANLKKLPYQDVKEDNPYYQEVLNLYKRHFLDDIPTGKTTNLGINDSIKRSEFSDIMLKIFCIIPRREAYEAPAVFTDINFSTKLPWYYAITKEAYFQGFITGYKGEIIPEIGKTPFKPDATITRAEAVKVILEALQKRGVIEMGKVPLAEPYYLPYLQIAQDLTPYLKKTSAVKKPFIITAEEASKPDLAITRGAFIAMADRVLTAYDCTLLDEDNDGSPGFWERKNGLNPFDPTDANPDLDKDGLSNKEEYQYGTDAHNPDTDGDGLVDGEEITKYKTDPLNPDTDGGGIQDGIEVKRGTAPLNRHDDYVDPRKDLAEGVYMIQDTCLSCPCPAFVDHTADIIPGDKIFAIISNDDNSQIFSKSNELEIKEIPEASIVTAGP